MRKAAVLVASAILLATTSARATPQPLPFTYVYETLPKGSLEVEQYVDFTPVTVLSATTGQPVRYGASQFQTEFEYGITDRLELGLYATFAPTGSAASYAPSSLPTLTEGNGVKERLRLRFAEEGQWPLDTAVYCELVENEREFEIEAKIILQRRIRALRIVANLWGEREYEFSANQADWVINPTLGLTYQVTPMFHPGVESWLRAEFPDQAPAVRPFNLGPVAYVGPTAMLNFGPVWWATGAYFRVSDFNRVLQPGDAFGSLWIRTIIGLSF
jgi:hypothetical protein